MPRLIDPSKWYRIFKTERIFEKNGVYIEVSTGCNGAHHRQERNRVWIDPDGVVSYAEKINQTYVGKCNRKECKNLGFFMEEGADIDEVVKTVKTVKKGMKLYSNKPITDFPIGTFVRVKDWSYLTSADKDTPRYAYIPFMKGIWKVVAHKRTRSKSVDDNIRYNTVTIRHITKPLTYHIKHRFLTRSIR